MRETNYGYLILWSIDKSSSPNNPFVITISICETVRTGTVLAVVANVSYVDRQDISCLCHVIVKWFYLGLTKKSTMAFEVNDVRLMLIIIMDVFLARAISAALNHITERKAATPYSGV